MKTKTKTFEKGTDPVLLEMFISEVVETVYVPSTTSATRCHWPEAVTKHKYRITITKVEE